MIMTYPQSFRANIAVVPRSTVRRADDVCQVDVVRPGGMIRAFEKTDIRQVGALFSKTFRRGKRQSADDLAACLEATYFGSPAHTPETGSIVHLDETGAIDGFMGVIAISFRLGDRVLRGGILSAYMAKDPDRNPEIGLKLARGIMARSFDLLLTDTANRTSLDISRALRFEVLPLQSLEWVQVFKPAGMAVHLLRKRSSRLAAMLAPFTAAVDAPYAYFMGSGTAKRRRSDGTSVRSVAPADFVAKASSFLDAYALKPAWDDREELAWFVAQAGLQMKYGALLIREVLDKGGRSVGFYLLYARRGAVAYALQILAKPNREEMVVAALIEDAQRQGAVAVRGMASQEATKGLIRKSGIVYHHVMSTIMWARDAETAAALRGGNVFVGGLAGETWARIVTEDFG